MRRLIAYEGAYGGLLAALRRTREPAAAPPPAHAAPSPHPAADAGVQAPLELVATAVPARAVEEEAEDAEVAEDMEGAEGAEGTEGADDWRAIRSAVRDVMYAHGDPNPDPNPNPNPSPYP